MKIRKPFYLVLFRSSLAKHQVIKKQPASSKWPGTLDHQLQSRSMISWLDFWGWLCVEGAVLPDRSRPENPFIKSAAPPPLAPLDEGCAAPESPKTPSRSSRLLLACGAGAPAAGDCTRTGVPARPSKPDISPDGSLWAEAGAPPSKSMSSRFSTLFCACAEGAVPLTAAAAAAASGFSRAF